MARIRIARLAFNRGLVSRLGLARADVKRLAMAAETQTNWVMRVLGSMMLRPGLGHLGESRDNLQAFHIPFVFSISDKASIELTNEAMRVWIDDAVISRPTVTTTITNGTFDSNLNDWTDADEAGGTSAWVAGGYMGFSSNGTAYAIRRQQVTVTAANRIKEHALHIVIHRGPVILRVGTSSGDDNLVNEMELGTGTHSIAFTTTSGGASFWIDFKSRLQRLVLVNQCTIEAAGEMEVEAPWVTADLRKIRHTQSGDVVFVACDGYQQRRIERHAARSWSIVLYQPPDGPFRVPNVSPTTLTASALTGNITLTASSAVFREEHEGALFQHTSVGQTVTSSLTAENTFTDSIRVTGVDTARAFSISRTGTWVATVTLQRSFDEGATWIDVTTYTTNATITYDDGLDNQDILYRIGVKTGDYTSGTVELTLAITTGSITGVVRIIDYTSETSVTAEVISSLGSLVATENWAEGQWSEYRGYPTAVEFHEGRLGWAGRDQLVLSISDAFDGFDPDFEGDAGPIQRSIGSGPVDNINWMISLGRLILGGQGAEFAVRSSSLDEPLTPTNCNIKDASTQGSAPVAGVKVDRSGIYVQRGGVRVYELAFGADGIDYDSSHLSALVPEIGSPGIVKIVVQRQPDTRVHFLRSDGTVAMLIFDKTEEVVAFLELETDGEVEDADVVPGDEGDEEDFVYYSVKRTIDGTDKRFREKWAFESEARGGTQNKQADCFITYSQAASSTISVPHLVGESVVVWDNGKCLRDADGEIAEFTVSAAGTITVTNAGAAYEATVGVVGLPYEAPWKSAKLVELMQTPGGSLTDHQQLKSIGLILADVHAKGLKFGQSLTEADMNNLPEIEEGAPVDADTIHTAYATERIAFPGIWSTDARLCLLAKAPRPCTVLAAIAELEYHG